MLSHLSVVTLLSLASAASVGTVIFDSIPFELSGDFKKDSDRVEFYLNDKDQQLVDWKADKYVVLKDGKLGYSDSPGQSTWKLESGSFVNSEEPDKSMEIAAGTDDEDYTPGQGTPPHQYADSDKIPDEPTSSVGLAASSNFVAPTEQASSTEEVSSSAAEVTQPVEPTTQAGEADKPEQTEAPVISPMTNAGTIPQFGVAAAAAAFALLA
ncbi:hypothetical protein DICA1_C10440 [Diutina catenulata]